ncbi:type II toxin-antitoxin system Phd/YefM family antitoxin [Carbonactinospora thermoautotrophica]|uniref:type II toxin-antitoxin system Phd/YefM family antitoxin n=2 Tax=Carbonactinospora thermoautotrophica TaxID=1469144 RepID=UPI0022722C05|nr:hypothetical protein [Carbonactinospora thermoautotrophica]
MDDMEGKPSTRHVRRVRFSSSQQGRPELHEVRGRWTGRVVPVRDLRNPGPLLDELLASGETAQITNRGQLVAWLVPATPEERRREELVAAGRLRPGRPGGLAGRRRMPRQEAGRSLSEALQAMRAEEDR